jgi:hypothetical protein
VARCAVQQHEDGAPFRHGHRSRRTSEISPKRARPAKSGLQRKRNRSRSDADAPAPDAVKQSNKEREVYNVCRDEPVPGQRGSRRRVRGCLAQPQFQPRRHGRFPVLPPAEGTYDEEAKTTLYASHTVWESHDHFVDWTKSQNFRDAHKNAGTNKGMYAGHPQFEGFESVVDN